MASTFADKPRILPCPRCGEMIYNNTTQCRFCAAPLDSAAAEGAADVQEKVNNAVNLAKWIRNMAGAMWVMFLLGLVWTGGTIGVLAFFVIIPVLLVVWQIKFGSLKTADPDYKKAKRERLIALGLWLPAGLLELLLLGLSAL